MAKTGIKIKNAPLTDFISGGMKMPISDGSDLPKTTSVTQLYNFVKSGLLNTDGFALTSNVPTKVSQLTNDSKFVSSDVTDALAKNVAENTGDIERLVEAHDTLGHAKALSLDLMNLPTVVGVPWFMIKEGAPSTTPVFIGQIYLDKTSKKVYFAFGVSSASDWIVLN